MLVLSIMNTCISKNLCQIINDLTKSIDLCSEKPWRYNEFTKSIEPCFEKPCQKALQNQTVQRALAVANRIAFVMNITTRKCISEQVVRYRMV